MPTAMSPEKRGIAMVVYEGTKVSMYSNIKVLRELGCKLPIEIWYRSDEIKIDDPILNKLINDYPGTLSIRKIVDDDASHFYVKPYAVYHSHFDQVSSF